MLNSFEREGQALTPLNTCIDGNGHVTNAIRVCFKCNEDLNIKKGKKVETYKIGKYTPGQFVWGRWSEASVWWTYRGGASSRVPFV